MATRYAGAECDDFKINSRFADWFSFDFDNKYRPVDVLNTLRILVEEGGSDPSAILGEGETALHYHTGTAEQFTYLLHQEHAFVDLRQRSLIGFTVAEELAFRGRESALELSMLAFEREKLVHQHSCSPNKTRQRCSSESSTSMLLHNTSAMLPRFINQYEEPRSPPGILQLIRRLREAGVDVHNKLVDENTCLFRISEGVMHVYGLDGYKFRSIANSPLAQSLRVWIDALREAGVGMVDYLKEEEKIAIQRKENGDWTRHHMFSSTWWRVEWQFHYEQNPEKCFVSGQYEFWREGEDEANKMGNQIPGAWIDHRDIMAR